MKATPEQIQKLYDFTKQHFVEFYDLQTELVDHLANAIESQWQVNPKLSFEELVQVEFKKFGIYGFQDVIENRQSALRKSYNKIVWNNFKAFFSVPKVIGILLSSLILFQLLSKVTFAENLLFVIYCTIIITIFIKLFLNKKQTEIRFKQTDKKWFFDHCIQNYGYTGIFSVFGSIIPNVILKTKVFLTLSPAWLLLFSFLTVALILFFYIILFQIPSKTEQYLLQKYPDYKIYN